MKNLIKTITTIKGKGKIVRTQKAYSNNIEVDLYVLIDNNGNYLARDINYNILHRKLIAL
jgi:hypothetical protein